jgi:HEAT repeat protein
MRLDSPRTLPTIQQALRDSAPAIRMHAAAALVGRKERNLAAILLRALDQERDDEVAAAFLIALGRIGTPDAVERLIAAAKPDRGLFRRKPVTIRIAAVQGLSEARTDAAVELLMSLQSDKDEDVRATASYALGRLARMSTDAGSSD